MNNNVSPDYLFSLVPQSVETTTHYSLRDATNFRQPLQERNYIIIFYTLQHKIVERSSC